MKTRTITVTIQQEPEQYKAMLDAFEAGREYEGCRIVRYAEYPGRDGLMVGEFILMVTDG